MVFRDFRDFSPVPRTIFDDKVPKKRGRGGPERGAGARDAAGSGRRRRAGGLFVQ